MIFPLLRLVKQPRRSRENKHDYLLVRSADDLRFAYHCLMRSSSLLWQVVGWLPFHIALIWLTGDSARVNIETYLRGRG